MKTTYIDCGSGIAGDMLLGALIGLGLSSKELERTLQAAIREKGWSVKVAHTERQQWPAWNIQVTGDRPFGSIDKMRACVRKAALPGLVKTNALSIFDRLQKAEAHAHRHGAGAFDPQGLGLLDTLIDVLGNCWGFWKLNILEAVASPLSTGRLAPATAAMLQEARVPVYSSTPKLELATPTGVAILLQFVKEFKPMPELHLEKTGYGAGLKNTPGQPNVLAIYQGNVMPHPRLKIPLPPGEGPATAVAGGEASVEVVLLLETVIDDMDPRLYPHVMDLVLKAGALDVWWVPIGMKKGRPGISFSVLCRPESEITLRNLLFRETTTLGIRRQPIERWVLPRTQKGSRKVADLPGGRHKTQTEFEVAKKAALSRATPLLKLLK